MNRPTTYGGQAVLEGVMIRGQRHASVAVRRPDGSLTLRCLPIGAVFTGRLRRVPMVRGILVLVETAVLGTRALTYSARVVAGDEGEELGGAGTTAVLVVSFVFAIGLFFLLPLLASKLLEGAVASDLATNVAEGVIRLGLFLAYLVAIGRMRDIRRVFMYHGAEHMTVHAQENGDPLTVAEVRKYPAAHPRCGTAFLLVVMVVAVAVFALAGREPLWWLLASRVVLIPAIAGASYEAIRFSGFHRRNALVRLLAGPSLALQALTTRRPDDDQIEVAIAAMNHAVETDRQGIR